MKKKVTSKEVWIQAEKAIDLVECWHKGFQIRFSTPTCQEGFDRKLFLKKSDLPDSWDIVTTLNKRVVWFLSDDVERKTIKILFLKENKEKEIKAKENEEWVEAIRWEDFVNGDRIRYSIDSRFTSLKKGFDEELFVKHGLVGVINVVDRHDNRVSWFDRIIIQNGSHKFWILKKKENASIIRQATTTIEIPNDLKPLIVEMLSRAIMDHQRSLEMINPMIPTPATKEDALKKTSDWYQKIERIKGVQKIVDVLEKENKYAER